MDIKGLKISVLGMARSGIAAGMKTIENGGSLFISEKNTAADTKEKFLKYHSVQIWDQLSKYAEFGGHTAKIFDCDYLIISPGIPLDTPVIREAVKRQIKVISEIEFGYLIKSDDSKIIAVTGSNGKSTTASLIYHLLNKAVYHACLAGNIGKPFTSFPIENKGLDYIVLELSSFQLELVEKFKADTAVLLNISPDHLDRYDTINDYIKAKLNVFNKQTENDNAVLNADDGRVWEKTRRLPSLKQYFGSAITNHENRNPSQIYHTYYDGKEIHTHNNQLPFKVDKTHLSLSGLHNIYNTMAALAAVANVPADQEILLKALNSFSPLPHRLEKVAVIDGVTFINDSKATNTESVKFAITAFDEPVHLIMGGLHKGEDYYILLPLIEKHCKGLYLIGEAAPIISEQYASSSKKDNNIELQTNDSLHDAVKQAFYRAEKGEIILLSPACASFDMFDSFEHRGEVFKKIVNSLKA